MIDIYIYGLNTTPSERMRVVELFAGVGGFHLGLKRASPNFEIIWANQWEPGKKIQHAFNCYEKNFGESPKYINEDISQVKDLIKEHDLLVGGFPCQDYSVARTQAKGIEGKKGVLWWHINDIIKNTTPPYVLLENVDRLLRSPSNQRGRDFGIILRCFADNGYNVEWRVLNAADYGFPQRRRRVFIFAYRDDTEYSQNSKVIDDEELIKNSGFFAKEFPISNPLANKSSNFIINEKKFTSLADISDQFNEKFYNGGIMRSYSVYTRECVPNYKGEYQILNDILEDVVDEKYYIYDTNKWKSLKGAKKIDRTSKEGIRYTYSEGSIAFPDHLDRPARTMLTSESTVNRSSHLILDKTERYRILTPIECERLNGFTDNWTKGDMPERFRYFTMGNSLVVPLVEKMGRRLIEIESEFKLL
jgi:DNA-methyltransferase (dcm)